MQYLQIRFEIMIRLFQLLDLAVSVLHLADEWLDNLFHHLRNLV